MNRRAIVIAATLIAGVALAGVSVAAQAGTDPLDGSEVVGALAEAPAAGDGLPVTLDLEEFGEGGVIAESSRLLGTEGDRRFWVARDAADDICLVVALGDQQQTVAIACNRADRVQSGGLQLGFQGSGAESVAYLLPDDAVLDAVAAPWSVVGDNLVVGATDQLTDRGTSVPRTGGGAISLVP